jgi:hypothetical protein
LPPEEIARAALHENAVIDDLRRRVAETEGARRRTPRPLWIGVAVIAVLAAVGLMVPDVIAKLLPAIDPSH